MEDVVTDAVSGAAKNFNDAGLLGSMLVITIVVSGLIVWYLLAAIKELKADVLRWQTKHETTLNQQIEENRNLGTVVESLAGQRSLMGELHATMKELLIRGAAR